MNPQIDLKKILQAKSTFLANMPFLVSWLKKTVHEKEINDFLAEYGHLQGIEFAKAVLVFLNVKLELIVTVPLDPQGRYIFVANHPLGGLDGNALIVAISRMYPELKFPVNDILLSIENLSDIFMPINKHGSQGRDAAIQMNEAYASDQQILLFPAGLVSRKRDGKIIDLSWQKHFIKKAIEHKRDIVPVYIQGQNSEGFYRLANWRKRLGIPFNIEMLFLPDEMFKQKGNTIKIIIGKPLSYKIFDKEHAQDWCNLTKERVYDMERNY
ncbi:MAG: glycerol acyltransferase [candidate division SR1 bacterium]|nr:glycerol acyltransferase [candidate division SR1 bacterium]